MVNPVSDNLVAQTVNAGQGITATTLLTLSSAKRIFLTSIHFRNTKATKKIVELFKVPNAGSAQSSNRIYRVVLASGETWQWNGFRVIDDVGTSIRVLVDQDILYGDADADGDVDNDDSTLINSIATSIEPTPAIDSDDFTRADADGDGIISANDTLQVTQLVAGVRSTVSGQDDAVFITIDGVQEDI